MIKRAFESLKVVFIFVLFITTIISPVFATDSQNHDLADNKKTEYELPQTGKILPNNVLFPLKKLRDEASLIITFGPDKAKLLVNMSDRYTAYGQKMTKINKPQSAFALFEQSINYQEELAVMLKKLHNDKTIKEQDLCYKAIQSNIKQAEVIRGTLTDLSASDQAALAKILEKNMATRRLLEICDN